MKVFILFTAFITISSLVGGQDSIVKDRRFDFVTENNRFSAVVETRGENDQEFHRRLLNGIFLTSHDSVVSLSNHSFEFWLASDSAKKIELSNNQFSNQLNIYPANTRITFWENTFNGTVSIADKDAFNPGKERKENVVFVSSRNHYQTLSSRYVNYDEFFSLMDIQILLFDVGDCSFNSFYTNHSTIKDLKFHDVEASNLIFDSTTINNLKMSGELPDRIIFNDCKIYNWDFDFWTAKNHIIYINGDFNYDIPLFSRSISRYSFVFGNRVDLVKAEMFLKKVYELQQKMGSSDDIEKADILLKNLQVRRGDFFLFLQKIIWLYGYDRWRLFFWFGGLFLLFYLLNLFFFRVLIFDVYTIEELAKQYHSWRQKRKSKLQRTRYLLYVLLYSSIIFFGLKMSIDNFSFKKLGATVYLYFFYLIGLIFLFFVGSLFFGK